MRLIFMGTPEFAAIALAAVHRAGHDIAAVYSQPPRAAGRGMRERKSAVHDLAERLGLETRTPVSLKGAEAERFAALRADAAVVAAYGLLLPKPVLDAPALGCFNIHASLLPRWRGAAPVQRAIMAGDAETGVTIMRMEEGLDTGPTLLKRAAAIDGETTAAALHDTLAALGGELIVEALARLPELTPVPQPGTGVTYAKKISKAEARIDFTRDAVEVRNHIHGLSPFPGAWTMIGGARVKVLAARTEDAQGAAGVALDAALLIGCGAGSVRLLKVQREGKAPMDAAGFLRGLAVPAGTRMG